MNKHRKTQKPSPQNPNTRDGLQSAAVRTDSLPNGTPSPAPPTISTEYDVLSHALHHNGYWPERSLIILTAHNSVLGPSLRVNLPEEPLPESHRAVYLTGLFTMIPAEYDGAPLNRFYAIIVDGDNAVRQRQLDPATRTAATLHEIGADITAQSRISSWAHMLFDPRIVGERRCEDIIYAGAVTVWALNDRMEALTLLGPIEDLHVSRYQAWRTSLGDSIAPDATGNFARSPWDTDTTNNPSARDDWESATELWSATRAQRVPVTTTDRAYRQSQLDLCYWETAISAVEPYLNTPPELSERTIGDTLRELIPAEVAGHLRASLQPSTLTNAFEEHSTLEILSPETLAYLAGYGLDRTQQVLAIQRYTTDYIYYALGGAAPLGEPREEPIEPPHYGTRITRKARMPRSFTAALAGEGPAVRTVSAKCNQWQDWIRRTHRTIQAANLERWAFTELDGIDLAESSLLHEETLHEYRDGRVSPYAAETDGEAPATDEENRDQHIIQQLNNSTYMSEPRRLAALNHYRAALTGSADVEAPDYRRLNALELLSSLLVPGSNTAEYSALRTLQSWSNWLKGHSTYANLLRHEAQLHDLRLSPNIIDARLATGTCPAWLTARRANTDALTEGTTISTLKPRKNTPTYGQSS